MTEWYVQVGKNVGLVLTRLAAVMASVALVSVLFGEYYAIPGILASVVVVFAIGWVLMRACRPAEEASRAEVFASAGTAWVVAGVAGMLPFLAVAWTVAIDPAILSIPASATDPTLRAFRQPVNAWFESISGFTGSGLTMTRKESELPRTLLWWRSVTQWLGGLGVIVLTIAIVNRSGNSMLTQYYHTESPIGQFQSGDRSNEPSLLVSVFVVVTLLAAALFWIAGMGAWASINHAMTGLATGGFVVTDTSFKAYDDLIRTAALPVMFVGAIPLPAYYLLYKADFSAVYSDIQIRWLFVAIVGGTLAVLGNLYAHMAYPSLYEAALHAAFQFVSAISCTGFYTVASIGRNWPGFSVLTLTVAMGLGGAAGSTASGFKIIRAISVTRGLRERIRNPFPDETLEESIDESASGRHASANYHNASIVIFLWVIVYLLGVFVLLVVLPTGQGSDAVPVGNVLFTVASAQGNVGLTSGIVTPSTPMVPASAKVALTINMVAGRLEIVPLLVFLRVLLWDVEAESE